MNPMHADRCEIYISTAGTRIRKALSSLASGIAQIAIEVDDLVRVLDEADKRCIKTMSHYKPLWNSRIFD